jgi:hypothetical protein
MSRHLRTLVVLGGVIGLVGLTARATLLRGADHIDAPVTTGDAPADINDLFVFRAPDNTNRVVFAMTANPLIPPAEAAATRFPTDVLYQWKIDTDGDAVEDLVLQATVRDDDNGGQVLVVRGPEVPASIGTTGMDLQIEASLSGPVSGADETMILEGSNGMRAFAGVRDDPFYIDLSRLLEILGGQATGFRDPGVDALAGLNTLAIVVEMPISALGGATNVGVWATSSRATN